MFTQSDWAKEVETLEAHAKALASALKGIVTTFSLGPLNAAAQYGPDFDLFKAEEDAAFAAKEALINWAKHEEGEAGGAVNKN